MSYELFTIDGKRKYLTPEERDRFLDTTNQNERSEVRAFCLVMAYTGCRISDALALTADKVSKEYRLFTNGGSWPLCKALHNGQNRTFKITF